MEILKYIIPAFIVLLTSYLLIDRMLSNEERKRKSDIAQKNNNTVIPIQLRAYERLMLLLERTNPSNMVLNVLKSGMNCLSFQTNMIESIRKEFEHNYAQQVYVSDALWSATISTQENLIKLINTTSTHFQPEDSAIKFAEAIIKIYSETENNPTQIATEILKSEVRYLFLKR
ncbi:MAG: hypothetical protein BGO29_03325 [Bacteroidales bacterium 36-12]|nr:MAG: hypothetical protein BGO29_03325 [Bacteroidales bacterium 36-12]